MVVREPKQGPGLSKIWRLGEMAAFTWCGEAGSNFGFEGTLLLKTCSKLDLQKPCVGASGFQIWRNSMQKLCITHSGKPPPHISQDLEGYWTEDLQGQSGPGGSKQGDAPECGNQGAHPAARVGNFAVITAVRGFRAEPLDTSVCCDIIYPFLNGNCS